MALSARRGDLPAADSIFVAAGALVFDAFTFDAFTFAAFNGFDAALCDSPETAFFVALCAGRLRVFADFVRASAEIFTSALLRVDVLGDFLRDFLDIRLPFVAFGGSIIRHRRSCPANRNRAFGWASLTAPEYGDKEFEAPTVHPSLSLFGPDDEQPD